jgi:hypothetical protein
MSSRDLLSDADPVAEVRWFARGDIDRSLRPRRRGLKRTDWYHLETLSTIRSIKRRGDRLLEQKWRIGPASAFDHHAVGGQTERWIKQRLGKTAPGQDLNGTWIPIVKRLWRVGDVQVGRLILEGDDWWTLAVPLPRGELDSCAARLLDRWADTLTACGHSSAYPTWLIAGRAGTDTALTTSQRAS